MACFEVSERLFGEAFENSTLCERCSELCALVLMLQAFRFQHDDTPTCSQGVLLVLRAVAHLENTEVEHFQD
eukprot:4912300-Amphidinium_carterae.1